jgi:hypothetical protein
MGVQVVKCKCGEIFAGYREPECFEDAEWHKDIRKWIKMGYTVETAERIKFGECKCNEIKNQTNLFES